MQIFIILLAVGLATCDDSSCPSPEVDVGASLIKDGVTPYENPLLPPSLTTPASFNPGPIGDIPPAVCSPSEAGLSLDRSFSGGALSSPDFTQGELAYLSTPALCARHRIYSRVRPVIDECVHNIPVVKNYIRNQPFTVVKQVPVVTNNVIKTEEKKITHVPIIKKECRTIIEKETHHVPVVKKRVVPVIQRYTQHIPVIRSYTRPVIEECITRVPVVYSKTTPVIKKCIRYIPITERRCRPVITSSVVSVPVKQKFIRNLVEQRAHQFWEPCSCCNYCTGCRTGYPVSSYPFSSYFSYNHYPSLSYPANPFYTSAIPSCASTCREYPFHCNSCFI